MIKSHSSDKQTSFGPHNLFLQGFWNLYAIDNFFMCTSFKVTKGLFGGATLRFLDDNYYSKVYIDLQYDE